jgi:glycosyltransferase involved in cell wall biosynthesis
MRFLFVSWDFPPAPSGVGYYTFRMAKALLDESHEVFVVTAEIPQKPFDEVIAGIHVLRILQSACRYSKEQATRILDVCERHKIDIIEGADHGGDVACLLDIPDRPPVIVKVHGSNPIDVLWQSHILHSFQHYLIKASQLFKYRQVFAERKAITSADALVAPCYRMIEALRAQGMQTPPCTAVLPNPISPVSLPPSSVNKTPTILMVGRIDFGKGIQYLPAILRFLAPKYPSICLEVAGDDSFARCIGSLRAWLTKHAGEYHKHIRFLGRLDEDSLDAAYARSWVVIVPSRWDTFPTVVLEAMARSKPVVGSCHGGIPEMISGSSCITADPATQSFAEHIDDLLSDESRRIAAGQSLYTAGVSKYAADLVARQYMEFAKHLIKVSC